MISEGRHKARGIEAALGLTSKGSEQVAVLLEVTAGEHAGETITWYGYFTDKTYERTLESLRYLGWSTDDLADLAGIDQNEVSIQVEHEEDESGKLHARVRWVNRAGGLAMKETMDDAAARAFAARMRGAAVASRQKVRTSAASGASGNRATGWHSGYQRRNEPPPSDYGSAFEDEPPF